MIRTRSEKPDDAKAEPNLDTIEGMAYDFFLTAQSDVTGMKEFADTPIEHLHYYHHGMGTTIRNKYGLWYTHPLTEKWRNFETSRCIVDGIDLSPSHPDAISMAVIRSCHAICKAYLE